jgi:hypothetical protein
MFFSRGGQQGVRTNKSKREKTAMYASIRRYKTESAAEITRLVSEDFVPRIKKLPGFVAYYGIDTGEGVWASVSVFETKAGAEESNGLAAAFVKENNMTKMLSSAEITAGEVIAH